MTQYEVQQDGTVSEWIEAKRFEIVEGGVLVFYGETEPKMRRDEKIRAFKEWNEVEQV